MPVDALIVGAGPAGSAAARLLAQAGWNVVLAEKTEFPRRKVCGEFMSATTMPVLQSCGVAAAFLASAGPPVTRVGIYANDAKLAGEDR
jgi:flavin-dependent dehydrogenase